MLIYTAKIDFYANKEFFEARRAPGSERIAIAIVDKNDVVSVKTQLQQEVKNTFLNEFIINKGYVSNSCMKGS